MILKANATLTEIVKEITNHTILSIYPQYYPKGAVDFFLAHHKVENILKDIKEGIVYVIEDKGVYLGTITIKQNEICRLFVLPQYQGKGYGRALMDFAEQKIAEQYTEVVLDASFPAKCIYLKNKYNVVETKAILTANKDYLCYDVMRKYVFTKLQTIHYDGKTFHSKANSENGEVSELTVFHYHQSSSMIWADYAGGEIRKGYLIGTCDEAGIIDFHYQHINKDMEVRIGKCHSVPELTKDGKILLHERWQWLCGDKSEGSSLLIQL